MSGFFTAKQTESKTRPTGKILSCTSCGLYKNIKSPRMLPYGNFKKGIMFIGESPGKTEDEKGKPFQGKTGQLLQQTCRRLGVDLFEDCININACHCRSVDSQGNNRTPTNDEISNCRRRTLQIIEQYKPKVIILLGNSAVFSLIGHRWKKDLGGITKWRGWGIPDQDFLTWICPTFHPSFVERSQDGAERLIWEQDLKQAFEADKYPFFKYEEPVIETITDLRVLKKIRLSLITFDYETTGLKPHAKGHKIVCNSIAMNENTAFVFMMPNTQEERIPWIDIISNNKIQKMGHNIKFEQAWSKVRLHQSVEGCIWDGMIAAHILDNRQGITGLKFQTYVNFGIINYANEISPYFEGDKTNANSFNRIMELIALSGGKEKLMKYCGMDSIFEYRLSIKQRQIMNLDLPF